MDLFAIDTPILVSVGIFTVAFLVACSRGRSFWLLVDFLATAIFGIAWYFVPHILLGFEIKVEPDATHLTYTRAFAACLIGDAFARCFIRLSKDNSTQVFLLLSRVIACTVLLIAMIYAQYTGSDRWNQMHIFFSMLGNLMWMMGSALYYFQSRFSGGHAQLDSRLNLHLRMDGFLMLVVGCTHYAFPDVFLSIQTTLEQFDSVHLHMTRSIGAMFIGSAVLSFLAPGFLFDADKRMHLLGHLVKVVTTVLAVLYAAVYYETWGRNLHIFLLMESVLALNALLGYFAPHETERYKTK